MTSRTVINPLGLGLGLSLGLLKSSKPYILDLPKISDLTKTPDIPYIPDIIKKFKTHYIPFILIIPPIYLITFLALYVNTIKELLDQLARNLGINLFFDMNLVLAKANSDGEDNAKSSDDKGKSAEQFSDDDTNSDDEPKKPLNKGKGKATEWDDADNSEEDKELLESNLKRKADEISDSLEEEDRKILEDIESKYPDIYQSERPSHRGYFEAEVRHRKIKGDIEERVQELTADGKAEENKDELDSYWRILNSLDKEQYERYAADRALSESDKESGEEMDYSPKGSPAWVDSPSPPPIAPLSPGEGPAGPPSPPPIAPLFSVEESDGPPSPMSSNSPGEMLTEEEIEKRNRWYDELDARLEREQSAIIEQEEKESRGWFWINDHQVPPLPDPKWDNKPEISNTSNNGDKPKNSTSSDENITTTSTSPSTTITPSYSGTIPNITVTPPSDSSNIPTINTDTSASTDTPTSTDRLVNGTDEARDISRRNGRSGEGGIDTSGGSDTPTETGTSDTTGTPRTKDMLTETSISGATYTHAPVLLDQKNSEECLETPIDEISIDGFKQRIIKLVFENPVEKILDSIFNTPLHLPSWNPPSKSLGSSTGLIKDKSLQSPIDYVVELMECDYTCYIWDDAD